MTNREKINKLRNLMKSCNLDAYIIPDTDPHQSEYVAKHWESISWISGFTGSAGTIVVTMDEAGLWTDSRYFIQADKQLKNSGIVLHKMRTREPEYIQYLYNKLSKGKKVGINAKVFSVSAVQNMEKIFLNKNIILETNYDLIDLIWVDRPTIPMNPIFIHSVKYAGKSRTQKITELRNIMTKKNIDYHLLTSLDDIAWLFNIRGNDVDFNPVFISYALISQDDAFLFIEDKKIPDDVKNQLNKDGLKIYPYEKIIDFISKIEKGSSVLIDSKKTNKWLYDAIPEGCLIIEDINITTKQKAIKNPVEIQHIKNTMIIDGVALVKFYHWLDNNLGKMKITEITASKKLEFFRSQQEGFIELSFSTIAGYAAHGAIVHYQATPQTDIELKQKGLLLIDSGGQYLGGTTDITRTIALGKPNEEEIHDYTLVLKGHIDLATAKFPIGTKGYQLEILARKPLWDNGMNYGHGTGHGVGYFLNVHEGPQAIGPSVSSYKDIYFQPGMITSNEPGVYIENKHGIRIENLILCIEDKKTTFAKFLKFETITLCPIDTSLIDVSMLTENEKQWLNDYHKKVFDKLSPYIDEDEKNWLKNKTKEI